MLAHRRAADDPAPLEHQRVQPGPRQVGRRHQPVMPAAITTASTAYPSSHCRSPPAVTPVPFETWRAFRNGIIGRYRPGDSAALVRGGHRLVLHARDDARAKEAAAAVPEAAASPWATCRS